MTQQVHFPARAIEEDEESIVAPAYSQISVNGAQSDDISEDSGHGQSDYVSSVELSERNQHFAVPDIPNHLRRHHQILVFVMQVVGMALSWLRTTLTKRYEHHIIVQSHDIVSELYQCICSFRLCGLLWSLQ